MVPPNPFEGIPIGFALDKLSLGLFHPSLAIGKVGVAEAVPAGKLVNRIAEQCEFVVVRMSALARPIDRPFEIAQETIKPNPLRVDEAAIEGPLDQNTEFAQPEHRDGALPALPDKGSRLRA